MTKFITGPQALIALGNGATIQCIRDGQWTSAGGCTVNEFLQDCFEFRIAPKLITIGGMEIEAPETEAPLVGTKYYMPNLANDLLHWVSTWQNTAYDLTNLKRQVVHLSPENAVAHTKATILVSGGSLDEVVPTMDEPNPEDPLAGLDLSLDMDVDAHEPPPVEEHEDPSRQEKKPRSRKQVVKQVAETTPAEPANETAEFIAPPAVEFDAPQPEDLDSDVVPEQPASAPELSKRVQILVSQIAEAKTEDDVDNILIRYTTGLTYEEHKTVREAAIKRRGELVPHLRVEPEPPSLAVRIQACKSLSDLMLLNSEVENVSPAIKTAMQNIYNNHFKQLSSAKDGE